MQTAEAKKRFRQILWRLQSVLDPGPGRDIPLLLWTAIGCSSIPCEYWLEIEVFEAACTLVENLPGERLASEQAEVLRGGRTPVSWRPVGRLVRGLVPGERERLQNMYLEMLDKFMGYCDAHGQYDSGLAYGEHLLRHDRASERTYRRLDAPAPAGGRGGRPLRLYSRSAWLRSKQELGVKPSEPTVALY